MWLLSKQQTPHLLSHWKKKLNIQRDHKTKIDIGECLKKWINGISQDYRLDSKDVMMTHSYHIKETTLP